MPPGQYPWLSALPYQMASELPLSSLPSDICSYGGPIREDHSTTMVDVPYELSCSLTRVSGLNLRPHIWHGSKSIGEACSVSTYIRINGSKRRFALRDLVVPGGRSSSSILRELF